MGKLGKILCCLGIGASLGTAIGVGCSSDNQTNGAGGGSGTTTTTSGGFDAATCLIDGGTVGSPCKAAADCCSGVCTNGVCQIGGSCASDNTACTDNGACCSQTCTNGTCAPINPGGCHTLNNACTSAADCCSGLCAGGVCSASSFCRQNGEICAANGDCCGGACTIQSGKTFGVCSLVPVAAANCTMPDGMLCGGGTTATYADGGLPACGGDCCSRLCAPYGPTGVLICQPASGCHPVGDLCKTDSDCCGSAGLPGGSGTPVTCEIQAPYTIGVCRNPLGCKPNGDVCKLATMSCNASCDCCSGNCENEDTCHQDNLGVPRCSFLNCVGAGKACATSADCCNGLPCVPNPAGTPPYICGTTTCVMAGGACTTSKPGA